MLWALDLLDTLSNKQSKVRLTLNALGYHAECLLENGKITELSGVDSFQLERMLQEPDVTLEVRPFSPKVLTNEVLSISELTGRIRTQGNALLKKQTIKVAYPSSAPPAVATPAAPAPAPNPTSTAAPTPPSPPKPPTPPIPKIPKPHNNDRNNTTISLSAAKSPQPPQAPTPPSATPKAPTPPSPASEKPKAPSRPIIVLEIPEDLQGHYVIGRSETCDFTLDDTSSSRMHCSIIKYEGAFYIQDHDSSNGTYINGTRIDQVKLSDNDKIKVGDNELLFKILIKEEPAPSRLATL